MCVCVWHEVVHRSQINRQLWAIQNGSWELNSGALDEQYVLLATELFLLPHKPQFLIGFFAFSVIEYFNSLYILESSPLVVVQLIKIFQFCRLSLYSVDGTLCCLEAFQYHKVLSVNHWSWSLCYHSPTTEPFPVPIKCVPYFLM